MVIEKINFLKQRLENQIKQEVPYDRIYETSVQIDKLIVDYYNNLSKVQNV